MYTNRIKDRMNLFFFYFFLPREFLSIVSFPLRCVYKSLVFFYVFITRRVVGDLRLARFMNRFRRRLTISLPLPPRPAQRHRLEIFR